MVGRITEYSRSLEGKPRVTFEVDSLDELRGMEEKTLILEAKVARKKRSLNANAYFHVLVGKMADKLGVSKPKMKNILLARYGQREIMEDGPLVISIVRTADMEEREDIHCASIGYGTVNGKEFTHYAVIKPSHEYNTEEMSKLIDGTVEDAKELGIETLSPAELERMKELWQRNTNPS